MEKSEVVAAFAINQAVKVRNNLHIPDDLSFCILSKLPLKSLKRFGCVHKSWALLFENPNFMSMYSKNLLSNDCSYNDGTSILLHQAIHDSGSERVYFEVKYLLYSLSGERFENIVKLDWPNPFLGYDDGFNIWGSGSINGILCLECKFQEDILLWNLGTKEFKVIPNSPLDSVPYWEVEAVERVFGYDPISDDYKVIRYIELAPKPDLDIDGMSWEEATDGHRFGYEFVDFDYKVTRHLEFEFDEQYVYYDYFWEVYSLQSNSWRKLDVDMPLSWDNRQVYMNGMCHWYAKNKVANKAELVSFDLGNEVFFTTPIPSNMDDSFEFEFNVTHLVVLNGSIAMIFKDTETTTFQIFVLGDLGVKESWTKIFSVGPLPYIWYPVGAGKRGDMFFQKRDGGIVWFDLSTQMIEELNVITSKNCLKIITYTENPLPLGGISD